MESQFSFSEQCLSKEVKDVLAALQTDEARYRLIFNSIPFGLWEQNFSAVKNALDELKHSGVSDFEAYFNEHPAAVLELAGKVSITQTNQAALELYSATTPENLWDHITHYLTPDSLLTFRQELIGIAAGQTNFSFETSNYNLRHEIIYINLYWIVLPGFENTYERVLVVTQDITSQKVIEKAIRESERHYRRLFEFMPEGFALHEIILDKQGMPYDYRFLEVNPTFEALTGLKREQLIGKTVLEVLPKTESYWIEVYGQVALSGEPRTMANYSQALGKYYFVQAYSPAPRLFATHINDITQLKLKEAWLEQVLVAGRIAIWEWNFLSGQRTVDHHWAAMLGYSFKEAQQINIHQLKNIIHPDDHQQFTKLLQDYSSGTISSHQSEYRLRTKAGTWKWILSSGKIVERDADGKPLRVLGIAVDIEERKQAEQARNAT